MDPKFLKIILLAAVSDGQIQPQELEILNYIRAHHPLMNKVSDKQIQGVLADIYNKFSAGMETAHILDQLGREFTVEEKHTAYALAVEVCAADFNFADDEKRFIELVERTWDIPDSVKTHVMGSINLRYFSD